MFFLLNWFQKYRPNYWFEVRVKVFDFWDIIYLFTFFTVLASRSIQSKSRNVHVFIVCCLSLPLSCIFSEGLIYSLSIYPFSFHSRLFFPFQLIFVLFCLFDPFLSFSVLFCHFMSVPFRFCPIWRLRWL